LAVRWLGVGDHVELPADHVHEIVNVDATEAVSLHVYGPRLGTLGFHTADQELAL
jgi:hypothetical protein